MWNSTGLGTLGRIAIYNKDLNPYELAIADSHVTVIRPLKNYLTNNFLYLYFSNPSIQTIIEKVANGTTKQKELATATIKSFLVPLPPQREQYRIVQKIEELLPYIEEYGDKESSLRELNNSFPESLRKSILQWAVQGKLVPQDPSDEPASVLLEKIHEEKSRLAKEGKIKKAKQESEIYRKGDSFFEKTGKAEKCIDDEIPFDIPNSWIWCNLNMITTQIHYGYTSPSSSTGNAKFLRISDIKNNSVDWPSVPYCTIQDSDIPKYQLKNRDILIARTGGTIGKTYIISRLDKVAVFASYLIRVVPCYDVNEKYLKIFMESPFYWQQLKKYSQGTGQPNVNGKSLSKLILPFPPLAEQQRIVQKIEGLLTYIEEYGEKE